MASVRIEHLTKTFRAAGQGTVRAADDVSFEMGAGELLAVVGPSGSGKTTVLRLIAGLEEPDAGVIEVGGRNLAKVPARDRDVAMVFQTPALYPHMTAFENMAFGLRVRHVAPAEVRERVGQAAELLGLAHLLQRKPIELSGGEQQRVALGRAIVRRPKLFLLDEPLSQLDGPARTRLRDEIARLQFVLKTPMIYVTHDQAEALCLGDRAVVLRAGAVQQEGEPLAIYARPANRFVAGFIGSPPMNFFAGTIARENSTLLFRAGELGVPIPAGRSGALAPGAQVLLGLRPEHIGVATGPRPPDRRGLEAAVELVEPLGPLTCFHLAGGGHRFVAAAAGSALRAVSGRVAVSFQMDEAHFFEPETGERIA